MTGRRIALLVGVFVVCLAVAGGYFWSAQRSAGAPSATGPAEVSTDSVLAGPRIVFRNTTLGADYSRLALVPLGDPAGPRAVTPVSCERVYASSSSGVCITAERGMAPTYGVSLLDAQLRPATSTPLVGLPSRARMSLDGTLVATTTFVTGHSYAAASFSTDTVIRRQGKSLGSLESWQTTLPNGTTLNEVNRNYWGVTFAPDDTSFYATAASGGSTWLVHGDLADRTLTALHENAECPSLSPDGTRVAYKIRSDPNSPGVWRIAVLDLATGQQTLVADSRSVDDQVEWLDDSRLLYALPRSGSEATASDVWVTPADGSGTPTILIPYASSPAVVRT